jgi:hypothetical protein
VETTGDPARQYREALILQRNSKRRRTVKFLAFLLRYGVSAVVGISLAYLIYRSIT